MKKTLIRLAGIFALSSLFAISAHALVIGDSRDLGLIDPNHPASGAASAGFINILVDRPLGSGPTTIGDNAYTRTLNDPAGGVYPDAVYVKDAPLGSGATTSVDVTGYLYLLAKYDGPNYGSVVWYVGGLLGTTTVPNSGGGYGLSHISLFNGVGVPDGGSTAILIGLGLVAISFFARRRMAA